MITVVGYAHMSPHRVVLTEEVRARLAEVAARSSLHLAGVYIDDSSTAQGHQRLGFSAVLTAVRARRVTGVLVLAVEHLSTQPNTRDALVSVITDSGGALYVADTDGRSASPAAFPRDAPLGGNGHHPAEPDEPDENGPRPGPTTSRITPTPTPPVGV